MITLFTMEREYPYGTLRSTNGSKTKVVLEEKGLAYRVQTVRPGDVWKKVPEVLHYHPLGKVPWIVDGDYVVYDSTVINEYLDEAYPQPPLLPKSPAKRARVRALENFGDEGVLSTHLPLIWMPWWSPPEQRDTASQERGRERLREQTFPFLEQELGGRDYLCDEFSLADVPFMAVAMVLAVDGMSVSEFPRVDAYLTRLRARPSYRAIDPRTPLADSQGREA
ncbi:MAG: glutathione S-transferase family protein [Pseudomonadales bacterium]|nr:glutathione S-transferase family protein [Pseudomonadales bacterium]MCP5185919.1 glutathione S-transferase family protein [Pseudomonadales bacterium]